MSRTEYTPRSYFGASLDQILLSGCSWLYGHTPSRQPTLWLHDLCLEILTVQGNELRIFWVITSPLLYTNYLCHTPDTASKGTNFNVFGYDAMLAEIIKYHLHDNERMHCVLPYSRGFRLKAQLLSRNHTLVIPNNWTILTICMRKTLKWEICWCLAKDYRIYHINILSFILPGKLGHRNHQPHRIMDSLPRILKWNIIRLKPVMLAPIGP